MKFTYNLIMRRQSMKKHTVAIAGLGARGPAHIKGIIENPDRFEIVGIYDPNEKQGEKIIDLFGPLPVFKSAEEMLDTTRPDLFIFITHPQIRKEYIDLAIKYKVKSISMEKPMALSLKEAWEITELCKENNIKVVVSHQQKYLESMVKFKEIVDSGDLGKTYMIHIATCGWVPQLATHYVDCALWANNGIGAKSVVGHIHGSGKLKDSHPYADYMMAQAEMKNDVRLIIESGYYSPSHMDREIDFWFDNRITVYGEHGYAWAQTNGDWGACTPKTNGAITGSTESWREQVQKIQTPYYKDLADWLDDDNKISSCNIETAYEGYNLLEGAALSALYYKKVDLPVTTFDHENILTTMERVL